MKRLTVMIILAFVCLPGLAAGDGYGEIDTVVVEKQTTDISYRSPDEGKEEWAFLEKPALGRASLSSAKTAMLFINEFMADNKTAIENPAKPGSFEDWIEIYNAEAIAINLGGMYLTDNLANPTQWKIPAGVSLPSGGYLLFWADGDEKLGNTHTNFKLSKSGEEIVLVGADGAAVIDSIKFDAQISDVSYGRYPNGMADWGFMRATPGAANNPHNAPPKISDTWHTPPLPSKADAVWVTSTVTDDGTVADVTLTYQAAGSKPVSVRMYDDGSHHDAGAGDAIFGALIPALAQDTIMDYSVTATDNFGAKTTTPAAAPTVTFSYVVGYLPPQIFINEFMADSNTAITTANSGSATANSAGNTGTTANSAGAHEDWIELYNAGASAINLGGMYLTDNLANPTQWQIPAGVSIPSGGYLLFWADGDEELGNTHTSFKLNKGGEAIGLFNTDAKGNLAIDTVTFEEQTNDISYGRMCNGGDPWVFFENPTPGSPNFFPAGSHHFIGRFSNTTDSYTIIRQFNSSAPDSIPLIEVMNETTGRLEAAYPFWGIPAGVNFSIRPECNYSISITSSRSVCFKGNVFGK